MNASAAAVKLIRKNNPKYETEYPDLRPPEINDGCLAVPLLNPPQELKSDSESVIMINDKNWTNIIKTKELKYLEAKANYTLLYFKDDTSQTYTKSLGEFESFLPADFVRVHRSYIVNVRFVEKLSRTRDTILMKDKTEISVTKNADTLLQKLSSM